MYDPKTQRVFTFNGGSNDVTAIDAPTGKVLGTIALAGRPEYAVADGKGMVYDNIEDKSEIVAIDARTLAVKATGRVACRESPSGPRDGCQKPPPVRRLRRRQDGGGQCRYRRSCRDACHRQWPGCRRV